MNNSPSAIEARQLPSDDRIKQIIEKLKSLSDEIETAVSKEENEELKKQKLEEIREQKRSEVLVYMEELWPLVECQNGNLNPEAKEQINTYLFNITGLEKKETYTSHYVVRLVISFRTRLAQIARKAQKVQKAPENLPEGELL